MSNSILIKKNKMDIGQEKDMENANAMAGDYKAFMDYIAVCDHPELLPPEVAEEVEEG
jgi:hypothetical protein